MVGREWVRKGHWLVGMASGLIVLIVGLTGCVWAFEEEIRYVTQREQLFVRPENSPRALVSQLLATANQAEPTTKVSQIRLFGDASRAVQVFTADKRMLTLNPYTGQLIARRHLDTDWLLINLKLHRTLLLGDVGKTIIYWNTWLFVAMLLSGFVLWLPARWRQWRASFRVKWQAKPAKRTYDLHSVLGFYALPFLLLVAATGLEMASHGKDKKPGKPAVYQSLRDGSVLNEAVAAVVRSDPFETVRVNVPKDSLNPLRVVVMYPTSGLRKESTFSFDPATGRLLEAKPYEQMPLSARFWRSSYELHTGRILDLFGKCLAFLVGLIAASLPVTGFLIWRNKRKQRAKMPVRELARV